jgi:hypothetical protein
VAGEHAGVGLLAQAAGEGDDRGAVPGRHVPTFELQPVAGGERHVLVRDTEVLGRHGGSLDVRGAVGQE